MSKHSRDKGKRGEQAVCILLRPICPEVRTKRAGGESASQDRGRDLLGTPGLCVQAKEMARPAPIEALSESVATCPANELPVAFVKQSLHGSRRSDSDQRGRWVVVLRAEDFVGLVAAARAGAASLGQVAP